MAEQNQSSNTTSDKKKSLEDREFYYPTKLDPMRKVPGTNPYLDDVQRRDAEVERARLEDRKPDLENPPAMQSTPLLDQAKVTVPKGHKADAKFPVSRSK